MKRIPLFLVLLTASAMGLFALICVLQTTPANAGETVNRRMGTTIRPSAPIATQSIFLPAVNHGQENWWQPDVVLTWQWQLTTPVDLTIDAQVYDIDLFENDASVVTALHARGRKVICYISAGSWEDYRPDADQFPPEVIGNDYEGWAGEKWLDIRRIDLLAPIMRARLDLCRDKGFDAVEPDNIHGYTENTGFPLTYADQLAYNRWLADEAHARGLSIGLKNDEEQVADLLADYDWAITEECFVDEWCEAVVPFVTAGKPVLNAEYTDTPITPAEFCPQSNSLNFNTIYKNRDLDVWRQACR